MVSTLEFFLNSRDVKQLKYECWYFKRALITTYMSVVLSLTFK